MKSFFLSRTVFFGLETVLALAETATDAFVLFIVNFVFRRRREKKNLFICVSLMDL